MIKCTFDCVFVTSSLRPYVFQVFCLFRVHRHRGDPSVTCGGKDRARHAGRYFAGQPGPRSLASFYLRRPLSVGKTNFPPPPYGRRAHLQCHPPRKTLTFLSFFPCTEKFPLIWRRRSVPSESLRRLDSSSNCTSHPHTSLYLD